MSVTSASSRKSKFVHPEYFTQSGSLDEWFCNICTPLGGGDIEYMTLRAAQHHEIHSKKHGRSVAETETRMWWNPPDAAAWAVPLKHDPPLTVEEVKMRGSRLHVDHVQDMVPFWIKGVEAAEKGETLRLEEFLEALQEASESWLVGDRVAENSGKGWSDAWGEGSYGQDQWSAANDLGLEHVDPTMVERVENKKVRRSKRSRLKMSTTLQHHSSEKRRVGGHELVEDVARQQAADEQQTRRMHAFFDMSTEEKVRRIGQVIQDLRNS